MLSIMTSLLRKFSANFFLYGIPIIAVTLLWFSSKTLSDINHTEQNVLKLLDSIGRSVEVESLDKKTYYEIREHTLYPENSTYEETLNRKIFFEVLKFISIALLTGSVINVSLNVLKYFEVFKSAVNDLIYTDKYLKNLKIEQLKRLWASISRLMYGRDFSDDFSEKFENLIIDNYFPSETDMFTERFDLDLEYEFLGKHQIRVTEYQTQKIDGVENSRLNISTGLSRISKDDRNWLLKYESIHFKFGDRSIVFDDIDLSPEKSSYSKTIDEIKVTLGFNEFNKENTSSVAIQGSIEVKGIKKLHIVKKMVKEYDLRKNSIKTLVAAHLYNCYFVTIQYPKEIEVILLGLGTIHNFEEIPGQRNGKRVWELNSPILVKQGVIIGASFI